MIVDSTIITEIHKLLPSFKVSMAKTYEKTHPFSVAPMFYNFLDWCITNNLDNESKLVNDLSCLPNYRLDYETFDLYKERLKLQRIAKKYRGYFTEKFITELNWDITKKPSKKSIKHNAKH